MNAVRYQKLPDDDTQNLCSDDNMPSSSIQFESAQNFDYRSIHTYAAYNNLDQGFDRRVVDKLKRKMFGNHLVKAQTKGKYDNFYTFDKKTTNAHFLASLTIDENGYVEVSWSFIEIFVIAVCYFFVIFTIPFSLIFALKFIQTHERLVIFRLGRLQKERKPGTAIILPCIDTYRLIDIRPKAFYVPPMQAVSEDNGVVQLGATVYYRIKDAVAACTTVADWNQSTRQLAHAALHRLVNKRRSGDIEQEKKKLSDDLLAELCTFTKEWGMEITEVDLSEVKVLKEGQSQAMHVLKTLMKPEIRNQLLNTLTTVQKSINEGDTNQASHPSTIPFLMGLNPSFVSIQDEKGTLISPELLGNNYPIDNKTELDLDRLIYTLTQVISDEVVRQVGYIYQVNCVGLGDFYLDLKNGCGHVAEGQSPNPPDCTFQVNVEDLMQLLMAQVNPLEAYMDGRLSMTGDTRAATKLSCLADAIKANFDH